MARPLLGCTKAVATREVVISRLRPVLMTMAAIVFGHTPLVYATGADAETRNSIGIMLVSSMAIGTFFTLVVLIVVCRLVVTRDMRPNATIV